MNLFRKPYAVKVKFTVKDEDSTRVCRIYTLKARSPSEAKRIIEDRCESQLRCSVTYVQAHRVGGEPEEVHMQEHKL